jgi:hypothetical protein
MSSIRIQFPNGDRLKCYKPNTHEQCLECVALYQELPVRTVDRIAETFYLNHSVVRWWDGKVLKCEHKGKTVCQHDGCTTRSTYGRDGCSAEYCKLHMQPGMVDVKNQRCQYDNCTKQPVYGCEGESAAYCKSHARPGMLDVKSKRCMYNGCKTRPTYGLEGGPAEYCKSHAQCDMIDVRNNGCKHDGCKKTPSYGREGGPAEYCKSHSSTGMVNVKRRRCKHDGCKKVPSYGCKGGSAEFCKPHAHVDMVDVRSQRCKYEGCATQPHYGTPGLAPIHCSQHTTTGDIKHPRSNCEDVGCRTLALYGLSYPRHCESHRDAGEFDLVQRSCVSCYLPEVLDANGHCSVCDPTAFTRARLAKQKETKSGFDTQGVEYTSYDRILDRGMCGLERPDFVHPAPHGLITEVDESQHCGYQPDCEMIRMINITGSVGLPIRYNPDKYKTAGEEQLPVKKRLDELVRVIRYWQEHPLPQGGQTFAVYMFYDGDDRRSWTNPILIM